MSAKVSLFRTQLTQFADEFGTIRHGRVVRLISTEETPDWFQRSHNLRCMHGDCHREGICIPGTKAVTAKENQRCEERLGWFHGNRLSFSLRRDNDGEKSVR